MKTTFILSLFVLALSARAEAANYHCEATEFSLMESSAFDLVYDESENAYRVKDFSGAVIGTLLPEELNGHVYWYSEEAGMSFIISKNGKALLHTGFNLPCEKIQ